MTKALSAVEEGMFVRQASQRFNVHDRVTGKVQHGSNFDEICKFNI